MERVNYLHSNRVNEGIILQLSFAYMAVEKSLQKPKKITSFEHLIQP